jgi:murein DD-endopeptidase MepM/ murein hydrolase activator NlpD
VAIGVAVALVLLLVLAASASASTPPAPVPAPEPEPEPEPEPPPAPEPEPEPPPAPEPEPEPEPPPAPEPPPPPWDWDDELDEPVWPLPEWPPETVQRWASGARTFGAYRAKSDYSEAHNHAGVDLGPPREEGEPSRAYGAQVLSPVAGVVDVVDGGWATGDTRRIDVVSPVWGRIVLGGVQGQAEVVKGQQVEAGQLVGYVAKYGGGGTMLHIEQHDGDREKWPIGVPMPSTIIDPRDPERGVLARWA